MLDVLIVSVLGLATILALPRWRHSRGWGMLPAAVGAALLLAFVFWWYALGPLLTG